MFYYGPCACNKKWLIDWLIDWYVSTRSAVYYVNADGVETYTYFMAVIDGVFCLLGRSRDVQTWDAISRHFSVELNYK